MLKAAVRGGNLAPYLIPTKQAVPSYSRPIIPAFQEAADGVFVEPAAKKMTSYSLSTSLLKKSLSVTKAVGGTSQVRYAHTDLKVPDFSEYRRRGSADTRKAFSYTMGAAGYILTAYGAKTVVTGLLSSMNPSADVMALAKIEINLADIPEGKNITVKWGSKPLFVRHRTAEEIEGEAGVDVSTLRDQEHDLDRVQRPEYLVVLGICTHLGCVPIAGKGEFGGYFCPCHGSHYDASGRIRKGPAPRNLEVPKYTFKDENTLVVG